MGGSLDKTKIRNTQSGQELSSDVAKVKRFSKTFEEVIRQNRLSKHKILNSVETGVLWKNLSDRTYVDCEERNAQ